MNMQSKRNNWLKKTFLLLAIVLAVIGALFFDSIRYAWLVHQARRCLKAGDHQAAFGYTFQAFSIHPECTAAAHVMQTAGRALVDEEWAGLDFETQVHLANWLAAIKDWERYVKIMDEFTLYIPKGEFLMGSDDGHAYEHPLHTVFLDAYEIDRFEVTNAQYQRFINDAGAPPPDPWNGDRFPEEGGSLPVVGISWLHAQAYCQWAGKSLPSEAQWEKACRGTDGRAYPWGQEWDADLANVDTSEYDLMSFEGVDQDWQVWWQLVRVPKSGDAIGLM